MPVWENQAKIYNFPIQLGLALGIAQGNAPTSLIFLTILQKFSAKRCSSHITKQCEAFIPTWAIKQINVRRLKNGSTPSYVLKYVIKDKRITKDYINIKVNEFVWYNEQSEAGETGIYTFPDMSIKKDWKNNDENSDKKSDKNKKCNAVSF